MRMEFLVKKLRPANRALFALLCLAIRVTSNEADASLAFTQSFALRSTVEIIGTHGEIKDYLQTHLSESYSIEQKRAKISFEFVNLDSKASLPAKSEPQSPGEGGEIFYDAERDIGVLVGRKQAGCQTLRGAQVSELIRLPLPVEEQSVLGEELFVATSKLLLFLRRQKMVLINLGLPSMVRNVRCIAYGYQHSAQPPALTINFTVYYSELARAADEFVLPLQVIMELSNGRTVIVDIAQLEALPADPLIPGDLRTAGHQSSGDSASLTLDRWAFTPRAGCARALASLGRTTDPMARPGGVGARFSLRARHEFVPSQASPPILRHLFVAYDDSLGSLRVDEWLAMENLSPLRTQRRLSNYKLERAYHVLEGPNLNETDYSEFQTKIPTSQCVVVALPETQQVAGPSKLPTGADDYVYLGRATVRGLDAELFERDHNRLELPDWLDASKPIGLAETPLDQSQTQSVSYTTLLYVAHRGSSRVPIRLEFYARQSDDQSNLRSLHVVNLLDFQWNLEVPAPNGDPPAELFSLSKACSATSTNPSQYARVHLQLEADENQMARVLLDEPQERKLALVAALQSDLSLPATMLYDLETRVSKPTNNLREPRVVLWASFRIAEHVDQLVEFSYLGHGVLEVGRSAARVPAISLLDCLFQVAHTRPSASFAYRPSDSACLISPANSALWPINPAESTFQQSNSANADLELFFMRRNDDARKPAVSWLTGAMSGARRHKILGQTLNLPITTSSTDKSIGSPAISMTVTRLHVDELDLKMPLRNAQGVLLNTAKISSFEIYVGPGTESWRPGKSSTTSLAACEAACLSNAKCRSYSACVRNSQIECTLSSVSFRSPSLIKQLDAVRVTGAKKMNQRPTIELDADESAPESRKVSLIWNPRCDIYNKIYINLFSQPNRVPQAPESHNLRLVDDLESCASLCYEETIARLLIEAPNSRDVTFRLANGYSQSAQSISELLSMIASSRKRLDDGLCKNFFYAKRAELDEQQETSAKNNLIETPTKEEWENASGLCILHAEGEKKDPDSQKKNPELEARIDKANTIIYFDMYQLRFETFFEKNHGIRLLSSPMSMSERSALNKLQLYEEMKKSPKPIEDDALAEYISIARQVFTRGSNNQEALIASESRCAMACFLQLVAPWPACKSFDMIVEQKNGRTMISCKLNSITLKEVMESQKLELIDENTSKRQIWHFEPRDEFALEGANLATGQALIQGDQGTSTRIGTGGVIFVIIVAAVSGLVLGIFLSNRILKDKRRESKVIIVEPSVLFKNQVDSEGKMPE